MFDELDRSLGIDYNPNLWSDEAMYYVRGLVDDLDDADWARLQSIWSHKPIEWQVRLAQAAFAAENTRVLHLLRQMLRASNTRVALTAAKTLNEEVADGRWLPDLSVRQDLWELSDHLRDENRLRGEDSAVIKSLLEHTPTPVSTSEAENVHSARW